MARKLGLPSPTGPGPSAMTAREHREKELEFRKKLNHHKHLWMKENHPEELLPVSKRPKNTNTKKKLVINHSQT